MKANLLQSVFTLVVGSILLLVPLSAWGQSSNELEAEIEERSDRIRQLEEEIGQYEVELQDTRQESSTLQSAVSQLDENVDRISGQVANTQSSINRTQKEIANLEASISEIERSIKQNHSAIAQMVKVMQQNDNQTFVETILSADTFGQAWERIDQLQQIQSRVQTQLEELRTSRAELASQQAEAQAQQAELRGLRSEYADQQAIVEDQKQEKARLLAATNQEASEYEQMITERRRLKEQFEAELRSFEEQLNAQASGATISEDSVRFSWPISPVVITQLFGGTEFARRNPGVYGRPFHNGTDFGAPIGTPVTAPAGGTVRGSGNTDVISGCYSYGKWILVDHPTGVSTLYAHLSQIAVQPGDQVARGDRIGYVGNTGYSTGPHLHFTVYVRQDVEIVRLGDVKTRTNCASAEIPVSPLDSYLNPMDYLPSR
ncbi:MAG: peptidoglycan DD-metalloendopeptidase family protein [Candidatus Paceibacterota bacterium]